MDAPPNPRPAKPRGRVVALVFVVVWVVMLVGLYWVIVKLKRGGAEALRSPPHGGAHAAAPASGSTPTDNH